MNDRKMRDCTEEETKFFREKSCLTGKEAEHPLEMDGDVVRFKANKAIRMIVHANLEGRILTLNEIAVLRCEKVVSEEEVRELYRLMGYSVSGYFDCFPEEEEEEQSAQLSFTF